MNKVLTAALSASLLVGCAYLRPSNFRMACAKRSPELVEGSG